MAEHERPAVEGGPVNAPPVMFESIARNVTLSDKVVALIRQSIVEGRLSIGDRLPSERELGMQFGVSRTVIREAIRSLVAKGLIEASGRGYRVTPVDSGAVSESMTLFLHGRPLSYAQIHEMRTTIEIAVAALAAERRTPEDVERMLAQIDAMASAADLETAARADLEFHRAVAMAAHNELYLVMLDSVTEVMLEFRRLTQSVPKRIQKGVRAHRRIARGIQDGDREGAIKAMQAHLDESFRAWLQLEKARVAESSSVAAAAGA